MDFHEEIEYLIAILKKNDDNSSAVDTLDRLESLLEQYAKTYYNEKYDDINFRID